MFIRIRLQLFQLTAAKVVVDYLKSAIENGIEDKEDILKNSFAFRVDSQTGEVLHPLHELKFDSMTLKYWKYPEYFGKRWELSGSLHHLYHGGINSNEFNVDQVIESIVIISDVLKINPKKCPIENLEIGVNLHLSYCPDILINDLYYFDHKSAHVMRGYVGKEIVMTDYTLKVYNKSTQSGITTSSNIIRFEARFKASRELERRFGVSTLFDLADYTKLKKMAQFLQNCSKRIVVLGTDLDDATQRQARSLEIFENPRLIDQLKAENPRQFKYRRDDYLSIQNSANPKVIEFQQKVRSMTNNLCIPSPKYLHYMEWLQSM